MWSGAKLWTFPRLIPNIISFDHFKTYGSRLLESFWASVSVALVSVAISLVLSIIILEFVKYTKRRQQVVAIVFMPLIVPTVVYVAGVHILFLYLMITGSFMAVVWAHMQYVLPYMFLILYGPFMAYNENYILVSRTMGKPIWYSILTIKIPMLWNTIMYSAGVGLLVSFAQYLTTLFIGGGRYNTLTLFMVTLSSGGSRRILGTVGVLLMIVNGLALFVTSRIAMLQRNAKEISL